MIGVIETEVIADTSDGPLSTPFVRRSLHIDRLLDLIQDPQSHFQSVYGWGRSDFDPAKLFATIEYLLSKFDIIVETFTIDGELVFEAFLFALRPNSAVSPPGLDVDLRIPARTDVEAVLLDQPPWSLHLKVGGRFAAGGTGTLTPPFSFTFFPPSATAGLDLSILLAAKDDEGPLLLLGEAEGSRIGADRVSAEAGLALTLDSDTGQMDGEPLAGGSIEGGQVVIDMSSGDSFIQSVLSGTRVEGNFDLKARWQPSTGMEIQGSGGIEIAIPTHISLGPLELERLYFVLSIAPDPGLDLELSAAVTANLGPLVVTVDRIGTVVTTTFPDDRDGNLGPANLSFDFKFPTAVGMSIDGGGFKGGGFMSYEPDKERYVGMLELEVQDTIALKAIALLTTRLPDGSEGFSLLIIITAEFSPIQIGFGLTLNGVGGLLGLNRTARIERLRTGVKDNTLSSILFPTDIVANANKIISDLRQVFPPAPDRFIFGPMAKIGWGTPPLITIDLGLMIEIPNPVRIAILGVVKAVLPDEENTLLRLQVNFLGVVDFEAQLLSFDASLYDSKLLSFTLSGDMALRLSWGPDPNFLLSVGGFHPAYQPPPLALNPLARLTLQLLGGSNPRIKLETYFAITSNTVQFGSRLELYAASGPFNVYGFLGFDVLFQFNPFYFIATIGAMLALRKGSRSIASISLSLTLEGTTPWHAKGTAKLKLFWFLTVKVRFDKTFGEERNTRLPDVAVLPLLEDALSNIGNWEAQLPAGAKSLVSLKDMKLQAGELVIHPLGILRIAQKILPLNITIQKFGNQQPSDGHLFEIESARMGEPGGTDDLEPSIVLEHFAPAHFFQRSDAQNLSSKSFELLDGGVKLADTEELQSDYAAMREVEYELFYIDSQRDLHRRPDRLIPDGLIFGAWATKGAVAESPLSHARNRKSTLAPDEVLVNQERFAVVQMNDLTPVNGKAMAPGETAAFDLMRTMIRDNPDMEGEIQVVPAFEVNQP